MRAGLPPGVATAGIGLFAAALMTSGLGAQQPDFSSRVEVIRVDVLVTDNGKPVEGLTAANFELLDNGVPQTVDLAARDEHLNVILALDASGSVSGSRLDDLRQAGRSLLGGLRRGDRAGLLTFSHLIALGSELTSEMSRVQAAVDRLAGTGDTALVDGTYAALLLAEEDAGRSLLVIFSDGLDGVSWLTPEAVVGVARRCNVVVYAVAVGGAASPFLRDVAAATGGRTLDLGSTKNLSATFLEILGEFRGRYAISFTPKGVGRDAGWHRLQVRVKGRRVAVKARAGYFAGG